jgi:hypothetical protein
MIRIKRIYHEPCAADGLRILVDRVWPRGLSKERARVDEWRKEGWGIGSPGCVSSSAKREANS